MGLVNISGKTDKVFQDLDFYDCLSVCLSLLYVQK